MLAVLSFFLISWCGVRLGISATNWPLVQAAVDRDIEHLSEWVLVWETEILKLKFIYDRQSVGESVLVSSSHLQPMTRFLLLSDICGLHVEGLSLWREDGSVIYSYNLLSLFGPSPAELVTSYCLVWDHILLSHTRLFQPGGPGPRIYIPQEQGGPVMPLGIWLT
jgi:hypothetical protein